MNGSWKSSIIAGQYSSKKDFKWTDAFATWANFNFRVNLNVVIPFNCILNLFCNSAVCSSGGSPVYGSDYEDEARFAPNGPVTSSQPPYSTPDNELLKQQLIDHHRDSPRPPFSQPQMVQGMTIMYAHNCKPYNKCTAHDTLFKT